jgi:hypothetical protein
VAPLETSEVAEAWEQPNTPAMMTVAGLPPDRM